MAAGPGTRLSKLSPSGCVSCSGLRPLLPTVNLPWWLLRPCSGSSAGYLHSKRMFCQSLPRRGASWLHYSSHRFPRAPQEPGRTHTARAPARTQFHGHGAVPHAVDVPQVSDSLARRQPEGRMPAGFCESWFTEWSRFQQQLLTPRRSPCTAPADNLRPCSCSSSCPVPLQGGAITIFRRNLQKQSPKKDIGEYNEVGSYGSLTVRRQSRCLSHPWHP